MQRFLLPIVAAICLGLIGFVVFLFISSDDKPKPQAANKTGVPRNVTPPPSPGPSVGQAAPEISGEDVDGTQFKLSDYRGKVVVLDFWGFW